MKPTLALLGVVAILTVITVIVILMGPSGKTTFDANNPQASIENMSQSMSEVDKLLFTSGYTAYMLPRPADLLNQNWEADALKELDGKNATELLACFRLKIQAYEKKTADYQNTLELQKNADLAILSNVHVTIVSHKPTSGSDKKLTNLTVKIKNETKHTIGSLHCMYQIHADGKQEPLASLRTNIYLPGDELKPAEEKEVDIQLEIPSFTNDPNTITSESLRIKEIMVPGGEALTQTYLWGN